MHGECKDIRNGILVIRGVSMSSLGFSLRLHACSGADNFTFSWHGCCIFNFMMVVSDFVMVVRSILGRPLSPTICDRVLIRDMPVSLDPTGNVEAK